MNDSAELAPELIEKAQKISKKLADLTSSSEYVQIMQSAMQMQKDNFDMLDRSLAVMQAVHLAELKNSDLYIDVVKFLIPVFATAAITGAAVTLPNVNSTALMTIGLLGLLLLCTWLVPLLICRHKKSVRQNKEYDKLAQIFHDWQKLAEAQKKIANKNSSLEDIQIVLQELLSLSDQRLGEKK